MTSWPMNKSWPARADAFTQIGLPPPPFESLYYRHEHPAIRRWVC
jgi:hypothetical protein